MPKAVAAHVFDKAEGEWYVEPPWCNTRLFEEEKFEGAIHDPCCGAGHIPQAAFDAGYNVSCADTNFRGKILHFDHLHFKQMDYTTDNRLYDNIVCNPPFTPCNKAPFEFLTWGLKHVKYKMALILPLKWLAGDERGRFLENTPLSYIYQITPRPSMPPGEYIQAGNVPGGGKKDYIWAIFDNQSEGGAALYGPRFGWLHRDKGVYVRGKKDTGNGSYLL